MSDDIRPRIYTNVFLAVQRELEYLHEREAKHFVDVEGHTLSEWIILIEEYLGRAKKDVCGFIGEDNALHNMRKIAAMACACMFYLGVCHRRTLEDIMQEPTNERDR